MPLTDAETDVIRHAYDEGVALPGTAGFAGELDGALVRDVLGREVVYSEADDPLAWSHDPNDLSNPSIVPAGYARSITKGMSEPAVSLNCGDSVSTQNTSVTSGDRLVWSLPDPDPVADADAAVTSVREAIQRSTNELLSDDVAVAFSGGVDSAIIASMTTGQLYVAGFEGCHDIDAALSAAPTLDRTVDVVEINHDDIRRAIPELVHATGRTNAMDIAISLPLYLVAKRVAADGYSRLALGQGADELFGGYAKIANAPQDPRVAADTVRAARRETVLGLPNQIERDLRALRNAGVEPVAPMLHDRVVRTALRLPSDLLVCDDHRKKALRLAAKDIPDDVRFRDKKAVQYGTYVSRELDRLARQAGFKRRMDDHVTQYIESLCDIDLPS